MSQKLSGLFDKKYCHMKRVGICILYYLFVHCSGDPIHEERSQALATALAKIFWRAGENKTAVVTM